MQGGNGKWQTVNDNVIHASARTTIGFRLTTFPLERFFWVIFSNSIAQVLLPLPMQGGNDLRAPHIVRLFWKRALFCEILLQLPPYLWFEWSEGPAYRAARLAKSLILRGSFAQEPALVGFFYNCHPTLDEWQWCEDPSYCAALSEKSLTLCTGLFCKTA